MCLYTRSKKPFIAKKDLLCIKYLLHCFGKYYSPIMISEVTLNQVTSAVPETPDIRKEYSDDSGERIYTIRGGIIHATLVLDGSDDSFAHLAIIPKGTKYWVDSSGIDVAAEKMIITDKSADYSEIGISILEDILSNASECYGIRVADYLLKDGSYIHPTEDSKKFNPIGRVVGFHKNKPLIASLHTFEMPWIDNSFYNADFTYTFQIGGSPDVCQDFRGKKWTEKAKHSKDISNCFNTCIKYRNKCNEQWYLPAIGELSTMLNNLQYLTVATLITGFGYLPYSNYYWSSSYPDAKVAWACGLCRRTKHITPRSKNVVAEVIPFLDIGKFQSNSSKLLV